MDSLRQPTFLFYLFLAIFLALVGWGGLAALLLYSLPTLGPRWLFFFLTVLALSGSFLPVTYFLNRRFPSDPPAEPIVILRQALWVGAYGAGLVWLQLGRMLNSTVAVVLALVLVIVEVLLRMRERSHWRPKV